MALPLANPLNQRDDTGQCAPTLMQRVTRGLHLWHLASLDAPTVAVVWALAFAWVAGVHLDRWVPLLLACGTFTVYVGDRLLDAHRAIRSGKLGDLRERHFFHWRHRGLLIPIACSTAVIAAALVVRRMPVAVRNRDSVLAAAALIYFSGVHSAAGLPRWLRRLASKELLVGVLFTAGCAAPTLSRIHAPNWPLFACLVLFVALAWLNCSAIESWESGHQRTSAFWRISGLAIAALAAFGALTFTDPRASALAVSAGTSAILLLLLDRERARMLPLPVRTIADLVLLTPLVLVMVRTLPV